MQATVRTFDLATHSGDVLLDDGTTLSFGANAFDRSGLRLLRVGQRVRLRLGAGGGVELVTLATFTDEP
jgi:2-phospho-L-lactate/phosphoenolpyruvate guanylyltransferase